MGALLGADKLVGSKKIGHLLLTDYQYDECGQFHEYAFKILRVPLCFHLKGTFNQNMPLHSERLDSRLIIALPK